MHYQLKTEIEIEAAPSRVWAILTDGEAYPEWNPFVTKLQGTLAVGETLSVVLTPPDARPFPIAPKVTGLEAERSLSWLGKLGVRGLFDGEHHFEVHPIDGGKTLFVQWESFSGLLVRLMKKMLDGSTKSGFIAMNEALKQRAEAAASAASQ
jgi:hypothetical protein